MHGREFELVEYRTAWGEDKVFFVGDDGSVKACPATWTDILPADPFAVISAGKSLFRVNDLLRLASLIEHLDSGVKEKKDDG
jgi:hypothetical protein